MACEFIISHFVAVKICAILNMVNNVLLGPVFQENKYHIISIALKYT